MEQWIDFRSDTVTRPTPEMRRAMSLADVGDDVFGEDPTVRELEVRAAAITDKEAALFLPSGTMANQVALHSWTQPGQQVILDERSHILHYELGAMAVVSGLLPAPIPTERGHFDGSDVESRIAPPVYYLVPTGLVAVETTHNMAGGIVFPLDRLESVYTTCQKRSIPVHMDGARIFNAATALGVEVRAITRFADSVMFCISKGLACPVGSLLCGPRDFIESARRARKLLGGGMRQSGILAAAGLVAFKTMVNRLQEDHRHARDLAEILDHHPAFHVDKATVQTNIIMADLDRRLDAASVVQTLHNNAILAIAVGPHRIRFVTHYHIHDRDIARVKTVLSTLPTEA